MKKKIWKIDSLQEFRELNKDMFKEHIATYKKLENGNDCIIDFRKPNTKEEWFRFIYIDGVLNINSDYGYAVFNWHNRNNHILAYLKFKDIGYIMSKCVASHDDDIKGFNIDYFHEEFENFIQERKEEGYISEDEEFSVPYCEDENDVINHFKNCGDIYGDDIWESGAFRFGTFLNIRPFIWWYGLHTAIEQLNAKNIFEDKNEK